MDQQQEATAPTRQAPVAPHARSQYQVVVILLLVALLAVTSFGAFAGTPPAKTKWDYQIVAVPDLMFDETMAQLGEENWELVLGRRARDSSDDMMYECVFKRPR